jgi:prenyltransferase beta subunit
VPSLSRQLMQAASAACGFLEKESRREIAAFILSAQTPDGGFRGRDDQSDLYYTFFASASLRTVRQPIPFFRLWKYLRSFRAGESLDAVHLACLIQLRSAFPMLGNTRQKFFKTLEKVSAESAYDRFLKQMAADQLRVARSPSAPPPIELAGPTPNLAASMILNPKAASSGIPALLKRACPNGGFAATAQLNIPDLLSTATALFALTQAGADLSSICRPCLEFVESLWRDSGGFAGHESDGYEDVEYTFYGLLSIGCLTS